MKKLLIIFFLFAFFFSKAQSPFYRSGTSITALDYYNGSVYSFKNAFYTDTSQYLGLDSLGVQIFVKGSGIYFRDTSAGTHKWTLIFSESHAPTWQQSLSATNGSTLTTDNNISIGGHALSFFNFSSITFSKDTNYDGDTLRHAATYISPLVSYMRQAYTIGDTSFHKYQQVQVDTLAAGLYSINNATWNNYVTVDSLGVAISKDSSNVIAQNIVYRDNNGYLKEAPNNTLSVDNSQTLTDAATITMNCNNGFVGIVTLGGNRTLVISNAVAWHTIRIKVVQDATGNRTLTLPANSFVPIGFGSGTTINLSTAGGAIDWLYCDFDGTNYFWTIAKQFQ